MRGHRERSRCRGFGLALLLCTAAIGAGDAIATAGQKVGPRAGDAPRFRTDDPLWDDVEPYYIPLVGQITI